MNRIRFTGGEKPKETCLGRTVIGFCFLRESELILPQINRLDNFYNYRETRNSYRDIAVTIFIIPVLRNFTI